MSLTWTPQNSPDNNWFDICYGNNIFVSISTSNSGVMISSDGINWTSYSSTLSNGYCICYGNGLFVALGSGSVSVSQDGIVWTSQVAAAPLDWYSVCYGNNLFVAVASYSGTGNRVMTSPDGITWTSQVSAADNNWQSVCYGNGLYVAVSDSGTNRVMTSADGITWTLRNAAAQNFWYGVTFGNGIFVACSEGGADPNNIMTSIDGITWTMQTYLNSAYGICYGNGLFVSVDPGKVSISNDGTSWTETSPNNGFWLRVSYGNGLFVAIAPDNGFEFNYKVMTAPWNPAPICFNKGTKILCLNSNNEEEYKPIELLKYGDLVKTYNHDYKKLFLIGCGHFINDKNIYSKCMYQMEKTNDNGLIDDLIVTGGHSILVDSLDEFEESTKAYFNGENVKIDDKFLHVAANCPKFKQLEDKNMYTYYHFILENDGDNNKRFGVYANGILTETPSYNQFIQHEFYDM